MYVVQPEQNTTEGLCWCYNDFRYSAAYFHRTDFVLRSDECTPLAYVHRDHLIEVYLGLSVSTLSVLLLKYFCNWVTLCFLFRRTVLIRYRPSFAVVAHWLLSLGRRLTYHASGEIEDSTVTERNFEKYTNIWLAIPCWQFGSRRNKILVLK